MSVHTPVLLKEVLEYLNPQHGQNFIDCTFGGGGHSLEILKKILPDGSLLAIDANQDVKENMDDNFKSNNFKLVINNFKNLKEIKEAHFKNKNISGILVDLGLSSDQLENSGRGFSFQKDEFLDMRFGVNQELTAADILNSYSLDKLYDIFKNYGNYSYAGRLSKSIFRQRKLKKFITTNDLLDIIERVEPRSWKHKINPATKIFQALRIEVNSELQVLEKALEQAVDILEPTGRLVVISFHSGEDRVVKNFFRNNGRGEQKILNILTKKPIIASKEEIKNNFRSRSAKMRCAEKI
ncbi:MAG: 16S rRNA (cytosine(1402)-N(4))-methyltransferase RsmH [Patescibacteria group bacterium]